MKRIRSNLLIVAIIATSGLQAEQITLKVFKDFSPLTAILLQVFPELNPGPKPLASIQFKRTALLKFDTSGKVTFRATIGNKIVDLRTSYDLVTLSLAEVHIVKKPDSQDFSIDVQFPAPKKQSIRAYKTEDTDKEWTVVIKDTNNKNEISRSTFKKDTDYKVKRLSVQLNKYEIKGGPLEAYNKNIVTVYKNKNASGDSLPPFTIEAGKFDPKNQQLRIEGDHVELSLKHDTF